MSQKNKTNKPDSKPGKTKDTIETKPAVKNSYTGEIITCILAVPTIFTLISLVAYYSGKASGRQVIQDNFFTGTLGFDCAHILNNLFGIVSFYIPLGIIAFVIIFFLKKTIWKHILLNIVNFVMLLPFVSMISDTFSSSKANYTGHALYQNFFEKFIGRTGFILIFVCWAILFTILTFHVSFFRLCAKIGLLFKDFLNDKREDDTPSESAETNEPEEKKNEDDSNYVSINSGINLDEIEGETEPEPEPEKIEPVSISVSQEGEGHLKIKINEMPKAEEIPEEAPEEEPEENWNEPVPEDIPEEKQTRSAQTILDQQHVGNSILGGPEGGVAGTLIVLAGLLDRLDGELGDCLVVGALGHFDEHSGVEQRHVGSDRADVGRIDLVIRVGGTAVADQIGAGQFLVQHDAHLGLDPGYDVEVGDVDDVIAVQLLLLVNGLGRGSALQSAEDLLLLLVALDVTLCAGLVLGDVREHGLDTAERSAVHAGHDLLHPAHLPLDPLGRRVHALGLGEQHAGIVEAIGLLANSDIHTSGIDGMDQFTVVGIVVERFSQAATALSVGNDLSHVGMGQNIGLLNFILIKNIVLHFVVFSFIFFRLAACVFKRLTNQSIDNRLLLFRQLIEHVFNGLFLALLFGLFLGFVSHLGLSFFILIFCFRLLCVIKLKIFTGINNTFFFAEIAVTDYRFNKRAGISSCMNQTYFTNQTMDHIATVLLQPVGINRKAGNIAMLNKHLGKLSILGFIEKSVRINTVFSVLQQRMSKNLMRIIVLMVPNQRHLFSITVLESVFTDRTSV